MKMLISGLMVLAAGPAAAHVTTAAHGHGSSGWMLGGAGMLVATAALVAVRTWATARKVQ